jgi:EpsI family protein
MIRRALIVAALLLITSAYLSVVSKSETVPIRRTFGDFPAQIGAWVSDRPIDLEPQILRVLGVEDYLNRVYVGPQHELISLYVGFYGSQRQGDTMHSPLNCLPGAGWNPIKKRVLSIDLERAAATVAEGETLPAQIRVNQIVIQKGLHRQVVIYWYQSHGRVLASEYWGKIYTVLDAIRTNRTDGALVRVICPASARDEHSEKTAETSAVAFVKAMFPVLTRFLPR